MKAPAPEVAVTVKEKPAPLWRRALPLLFAGIAGSAVTKMATPAPVAPPPAGPVAVVVTLDDASIAKLGKAIASTPIKLKLRGVRVDQAAP